MYITENMNNYSIWIFCIITKRKKKSHFFWSGWPLNEDIL
jgi:hypothetical protein